MAYNPEVHDDDLTGEIIGVATEIHKKLGSDQSESTYRDVLAEGLRRADLNCEVEHEVDVEVYGFRAGSRRLDLFVEEEVALELKVTRNISDRHLQQLGANVEASGASRGLVLNFGSTLLQKRRYATTEWLDEHAR